MMSVSASRLNQTYYCTPHIKFHIYNITLKPRIFGTVFAKHCFLFSGNSDDPHVVRVANVTVCLTSPFQNRHVILKLPNRSTINLVLVSLEIATIT